MRNFKKIVLIILAFGFNNYGMNQVRPNINSLSAPNRATLVNLMMDYITPEIVQQHCNMHMNDDIHSDFNFLPFHRTYIEGMEDYFIARGFSQFVPLPYWNPGEAGGVPNEFRVVDPDCGSFTCDFGSTSSCTQSINWNPGNSLPNSLKLPTICDWNMNPTIPTTASGTCSTCHDCCPTGLSKKIESPYHDGVHIAMSGVMGNFRSPIVPAFWLWHAFVDDLWKTWECNCSQSTTSPIDFYIKENAKVVESDRDRGEEPSIGNGPIYLSEDIWIRNQPDGIANQTTQNPEHSSTNDPNQLNYVYVRVRNRGCVPSLGNGTETLSLHWAKAATSLSWPNHWNNTLDLDPPNEAMAGAVIGIQTIQAIPAGGSTILVFPWNPPSPSDYSFNNQPWHFCLLARVLASNDPMTFPETSDLGDNVKNNNNIAWKNITVVDNVAGIITGGGDCKEELLDNIGVAVAVGNPENEPITYNIVFSVPEEELGHCAEENCTDEHEETIIMDVFGVETEITMKHDEHLIPITAEGNVIVALQDELYELWVKGGKKGKGFKELLSPPMSTQGMNSNQINSNSHLVISNRKMFEITENNTVFENITMEANTTFMTSMMVIYPTNPVTDKHDFIYDIEQKRTDNNKVLGGVRYAIEKPTNIDAPTDAGNDRTINRGCTTTLIASPKKDCYAYFWLNQQGNIISREAELTVTPNKTSTYSLKVVSSQGFVSEDQITVNVNNQLCLEDKEIIKISPNPGKDNVTVKYKVENTTNAQLKLVKVDNSYHRIYNLNMQNNEITLDISQFPSGSYTIVLIADDLNADSKNLMILK
jgi:hypothetical protein